MSLCQLYRVPYEQTERHKKTRFYNLMEVHIVLVNETTMSINSKMPNGLGFSHFWKNLNSILTHIF